MLTIEFIIFGVVSVGFIVLVILKSKQWSAVIQELYVRSTKKRDWYYFDFSEPWVRVLIQGALILFAIVVVSWAFTLLFGSVYVTQNASGQSEWHLQK